MSEVVDILRDYELDRDTGRWSDYIANVSADDVVCELQSEAGRFDIKRLGVFISPAASEFIEQMAVSAERLTRQRFGRTVSLYVPLYVSDYCVNSCVYCGYNCRSGFSRTRLSVEQACEQAEYLAGEGFRHILLVSGEDRDFVSCDYLSELAERLRERFSSISIEIYPMSGEEYGYLYGSGIDGVTLYQETYDRDNYRKYHLAGPKSDYDNRIKSIDRLAGAGMRRIGMGVLLGLSDWRLDTLAMGMHASFIMKKYWRGQVSFSFPRLRPARAVADEFGGLMSDAELVQMMTALRLCFADAGIVLSTRESARLRDNLVRICVTRMSAGSKTSPGGYGGKVEGEKQFEIADERCAGEIACMLRENGLEAVWKDWDAGFCGR